jgi:acyl carrier protein
MNTMMTKNSDTIKDQVKSLFADQFQITKAEINDDLSFGDLPQWDSLGHMSVIAALEDQFHVEVDADLIAKLVSIKAICEYLEEQSHG